jgi:hypothetical protein
MWIRKLQVSVIVEVLIREEEYVNTVACALYKAFETGM